MNYERSAIPAHIRDQTTQRIKDLLLISAISVKPEDIPQSLADEYKELRNTKVKPTKDINEERDIVHLNTWRKPTAYDHGFIGALDHSSDPSLFSETREAVLRQALINSMIERIHAELNNETFNTISMLEGRMAGYRWALGLIKLPERYVRLNAPAPTTILGFESIPK